MTHDVCVLISDEDTLVGLYVPWLM